MPRKLESLAGIRHGCVVDFQNGHVTVQIVVDIEILAIRAEHSLFSESTTSTSPAFVTSLPSIFKTTTLLFLL